MGPNTTRSESRAAAVSWSPKLPCTSRNESVTVAARVGRFTRSTDARAQTASMVASIRLAASSPASLVALTTSSPTTPETPSVKKASASLKSGRTKNAVTWAWNGLAASMALASTAVSRAPPVTGARILAMLIVSSLLGSPIIGRERQRGKRTMAATKRDAVPGAWQRMLSGRRLDLLDPSPLDIEIEDIAHGLARVARWNGQTTGDHALSVAQHALVVEDIAGCLRPAEPGGFRLMALLHDAPE